MKYALNTTGQAAITHFLKNVGYTEQPWTPFANAERAFACGGTFVVIAKNLTHVLTLEHEWFDMIPGPATFDEAVAMLRDLYWDMTARSVGQDIRVTHDKVAALLDRTPDGVPQPSIHGPRPGDFPPITDTGKVCGIVFTKAEIQSGLDRVRWAELLIKQLPPAHEGRNSWLLNYGTPDGAPIPWAPWKPMAGKTMPDDIGADDFVSYKTSLGMVVPNIKASAVAWNFIHEKLGHIAFYRKASVLPLTSVEAPGWMPQKPQIHSGLAPAISWRPSTAETCPQGWPVGLGSADRIRVQYRNGDFGHRTVCDTRWTHVGDQWDIMAYEKVWP